MTWFYSNSWATIFFRLALGGVFLLQGFTGLTTGASCGSGIKSFTGVNTLVVSAQDSNGIADPRNAQSVIDSTYDPQVEFLETAVTVNGITTMKTYGPDANGVYGGMQGLGGLEAVRQKGYIYPQGVIQDYFGNVLAGMSNGLVTWNATRFSSYGPVQGYQSPALSQNTTVAQSLGWRGKRVDETGLLYWGKRPYGFTEGCWMSPDPRWAESDSGPYTAFNGDPVNFFDPDGRFGKAIDNGDLMSGFDPNKESVLADATDPGLSPYEVAATLESYGLKALMLPMSLAFDEASTINTALFAQDDQGNYVSGWRQSFAAASILLPFLPVGEIVQTGLQGIQEFGLAEAGIAGADGVNYAAGATPGSIHFMGSSDQFLINAAARTDVDAGGYLDVVAHGNAHSIELSGYPGQSFDHRVLAQLIENNPQYVGQDIRLLSCSTGAYPVGFAQNLANKLGVNVLAPNDLLWAFPNGTMTIGPTETMNTGSWLLFITGGRP